MRVFDVVKADGALLPTVAPVGLGSAERASSRRARTATATARVKMSHDDAIGRPEPEIGLEVTQFVVK